MTNQIKVWAFYALWFSIGAYSLQVLEWYFERELIIPTVGVLAVVSLVNNILRK